MGRGRDGMQVRRSFKPTRDSDEAMGLVIVIAGPYQ